MNRFSIIQNKKECYVCKTTLDIHIHEVYFGKNRKKSIEDGCCVYLCSSHHNMSNAGVHFNHKLDMELKRKMQQKWCEYYNKTNDEFLDRFGRSYL